ncbi:prephenate dehydratase [Streptomyces sp. NPDC050658]|uniref:prephenate dehydratase n=1 Tax=unclassified Streptomyces TaxID=2593676 RepID=UPI0034139576
MTTAAPARFSYLGPEGTFSEAALRTLPEARTAECLPMMSIPAALDAARAGEVDAALVPIENSVEGGVTATLDELTFGQPLMIFREVLLPISFALLVRPGTRLADVKTVTGHPVAQPQVRRWLAEHRPDAVWESAASNADGARMVQEGRYDGAFAGEFAAPIYHLEPLVTDIHDRGNAQTRFILAGRPDRPTAATGADKTSLAVWLTDDYPGALLELLQEFASRGVNVVRIESRPTGRGIGHYSFSVDCQGHLTERRVGEALMGLKQIFPKVRFLGSYPRAGEAVGAPEPDDELSQLTFMAASDWLARCVAGRV